MCSKTCSRTEILRLVMFDRGAKIAAALSCGPCRNNVHRQKQQGHGEMTSKSARTVRRQYKRQVLSAPRIHIQAGHPRYLPTPRATY